MDDKWCPKCGRQIPDPGTSDLRKYEKYWSGNRCYYCNSELTTAISSSIAMNERRTSISYSSSPDSSYACDICSTNLSSKASGYFFDQNRVLTSPNYWEYLYTRSPLRIEEKGLGLFLHGISRSPGGFTVCHKCRNILLQDGQKASELGLEECVSSLPSGEVDTHSMGIVAGTVWNRIHGKWPSTIQIGGGSGGSLIVKREKYKQQRKWWQFWK